jgi:hypothetical protein
VETERTVDGGHSVKGRPPTSRAIGGEPAGHELHQRDRDRPKGPSPDLAAQLVRLTVLSAQISTLETSAD